MRSSLHKRYLRSALKNLESHGFHEEAKFLESNMQAFENAVVSPDLDHSDFIIPERFVPENLKEELGTSVVKFEHVFVKDMPLLLDAILRNLCNKLKIPYRFADEAYKEWFNLAVVEYKSGNVDTAIYNLGRSMHLAQDICVPMHCSLWGNLPELIQFLKQEHPLQTIYETKCSTLFDDDEIVNFNPSGYVDIPRIADFSKYYLSYCDGIRVPDWVPMWIKNILINISYTFKEDISMAVEYTNHTAVEQTILALLSFIKEARK